MQGDPHAYSHLIQQFMREKGITQGKLSVTLGMSRSYVSRLVNGFELPRRTVGELLHLSHALSLSPHQEELLLRTVFGLPTNPYVEAYNKLLSNDAYQSNLAQYADIKYMIAKTILSNRLLLGHRSGGDTIFFDSGSTILAIAHSLHKHKLHFDKIVTNNFVIAFFLAGNNVSCILTGGNLNGSNIVETYGALLGDVALASFSNIAHDITTTIMGTTAIAFSEGPCSRAEDNRLFKEVLITNAVDNDRRLIIVADFRKFIQRSFLDRFILETPQWDALLNYPNLFIVTGGQPGDIASKSLLADKLAMFSERIGHRLIIATADDVAG